jgi:hypothetical protein
MNRIATIAAEILATVNNMTTQDGEFIRIARFLPEITGTRTEIDEALARLVKGDLIALAPESNTKVLTPADERHAYRPSSEALHLIALQV